MSDIFISYAREDRATARRLARVLEAEGWSVFWDVEIPAGQSFDQVIEAELEAASCVVALWSVSSVTSDWVKTEASEGAQRRILVPALIQQVVVPLEFRRIQAADLVGWRGEGDHQGLSVLLSSIRALVPATPRRDVAPSAPEPAPLVAPRSWKRAAGLVGLAVLALTTAIYLGYQRFASRPDPGSRDSFETPPPTAPGGEVPRTEPATGAVTLRIAVANLSSGSFQTYPNPGPGVRILKALKPDVVLLQEFNVNSTREDRNDDAAVDTWVRSVFGERFNWCREGGGDVIPNGIISRFPLRECSAWIDERSPTRDWAFARIDIPGARSLWLVSVHFLTRGAAVRQEQARSLVAAIRQHVPEDDYLAVAGDLNTDTRDEPAVAELAAIVDTSGPYPDDGADPPDGDTNRTRRKPYDWLLVDPDLHRLAVPVRIGTFTFPAGLVFDTRLFSQAELDAHFPPALVGDSDAPQMQHMAVVRDFRIPF